MATDGTDQGGDTRPTCEVVTQDHEGFGLCDHPLPCPDHPEDDIIYTYDWLVQWHRTLMDELVEVRNKMRALRPDGTYRIALRPDENGADPMRHDTRLDDIVVRNVAMFRAERLDDHIWWVCCYLDNDTQDRICWNVRASARPRRIDWTTTEYPVTGVAYEHERTS